MLTGLYPHQHGQIGLATWGFRMYREDTPNLPRSLKAAGYRAGIIGKLHINPESAFPFDFHGLGNHALRNERWRYIRYADGGEELYDHQNDPNEWTNLAGGPEFATVKADLAKWLPKTDAPNLSPKAKRKKERKVE